MAETLVTEGPVVLDSSAVIAWMRDEQGADIVTQVVLDHQGRLHMHGVNVCEVLYYFGKIKGAKIETVIPDVRERLALAGIVEHGETDPDLVDAAAIFKARIHRVSLADCLLLALAARLGGTVVTADKGELDKPGPLAVCPIHFIR
jgi:PIN domain nuclease of toxin-antitoxin system